MLHNIADNSLMQSPDKGPKTDKCEKDGEK